VYVGEPHATATRISLIAYDGTRVTERTLASVDEVRPFTEQNTVTWLNVDDVQEPGLIAAFGKVLGFHPLMQEDLLNTDQRPKVEDHGDHLYVVLKMLEWKPGTHSAEDAIDIEQLSLAVGPNYVISFQERAGDCFDPIRARIRESVGRARKMGADYLAYSLLDLVVDQYFVVLEKLADRIERLEDEVTGRPGRDTLARIQALKREVLFVRKAVWPLREVVASLRHLDTPLIAKGTQVFLRDLQDHVVQVVEGIDTCQDPASDLLDAYLSMMGNRTNVVMQVLAVFSAVFMPLTFVTGIFGMNFRDMPPLEWEWGFAGTLIACGVMAAAMVAFFRARRWLKPPRGGTLSPRQPADAVPACVRPARASPRGVAVALQHPAGWECVARAA
jgi:magnesium transporter